METSDKARQVKLQMGTQRFLFMLPAVAMMGVLAGNATPMLGQGCVAAHSPQPLISGLDPNTTQRGLHGLTVTVGFRTYSSFLHFVGTMEQVQRDIKHNAGG